MCNSIDIGNSVPQKNFTERLGFMGGTYRTYRTIRIIVWAAEAALEMSLFPQ